MDGKIFQIIPGVILLTEGFPRRCRKSMQSCSSVLEQLTTIWLTTSPPFALVLMMMLNRKSLICHDYWTVSRLSECCRNLTPPSPKQKFLRTQDFRMGTLVGINLVKSLYFTDQKSECPGSQVISSCSLSQYLVSRTKIHVSSQVVLERCTYTYC